MHPLSLKETFRQLPKSLRDICGTVIFPHDNGNSLMNSSESTPVLMGASDASFHWGKATHAWVISTGVKYDITKPNKNIFGSGPVDGLPPYLSSGRGELHGLNAISIIADLLNTYHARNSKIKVVCDIKGIVNKCRTLSINSLSRHQDKNIDLYLNQKHHMSKLDIQLEWIKGHSDTRQWHSIHELISQDLSSEQVYNIWCNHMANVEWETGSPAFADPDVSPYKKWAIFSTHPETHKVIGDFNTSIQAYLSFQSTAQYVLDKHNLTLATLAHTNLFALQSYLQDLPVFTRASTAKLIHGWAPTYSLLFQQECCPSPLCPRCQLTVVTTKHVLICTAPDATQCRLRLLPDFLKNLINIGTPIHIITTFHYKLSILLNLPYDHSLSPSTTLQYESKTLLISAI